MILSMLAVYHYRRQLQTTLHMDMYCTPICYPRFTATYSSVLRLFSKSWLWKLQLNNSIWITY